jgi:hypothetical protein
LSFNLLKMLQGAVAQANPWDGGQTYASVVNQKKAAPPPPASTARPKQAPPAPSWGNFVNGVGKTVGGSVLGAGNWASHQPVVGPMVNGFVNSANALDNVLIGGAGMGVDAFAHLTGNKGLSKAAQPYIKGSIGSLPYVQEAQDMARQGDVWNATRTVVGNNLNDVTNIATALPVAQGVELGFKGANLGAKELYNLATQQGGKALTKAVGTGVGKNLAQNAVNNLAPSVLGAAGTTIADQNVQDPWTAAKQFGKEFAVSEGIGTGLGVGGSALGYAARTTAHGLRDLHPSVAPHIADALNHAHASIMDMVKDPGRYLNESGSSDMFTRDPVGKFSKKPAAKSTSPLDLIPVHHQDPKTPIENSQRIIELKQLTQKLMGDLSNTHDLMTNVGEGDALHGMLGAVNDARGRAIDEMQADIKYYEDLAKTKFADSTKRPLTTDQTAPIAIPQAPKTSLLSRVRDHLNSARDVLNNERGSSDLFTRLGSDATPEQALKAIVSEHANMLKEAEGPNQTKALHDTIRELGGIAPYKGGRTEYRQLPSAIKNKTGSVTLDKLPAMLQEKGFHFPDENALHEALLGSKVGKAKTKAQWLEEATRQLESGKGPDELTSTYKSIKDSLPLVEEAPKPTAKPVATPKAEKPKPSPVKAKEITPPAPEPVIPKKDADVPKSKPAPSLSTREYVKQQVQAQEVARKTERGGVKGRVTSLASEIKKKMVDSNAPIEDVLDKVMREGADIKPSENIKYQIDKALRAPEMSSQFIYEKGLAEVIQKAPDLDEFNQFLIAKHSQDLAVKEIKTGRDVTADTRLVKELAPKYDQLSKKVTRYSREVLKYAVSKGLIGQEQAKALVAEYPNYVPMNRIFGEDELPKPQGTGRGPASLGSQTVVQRLKGSEREVENPLESLLVKTRDAFKQGELNDAARMLASYKDLPGNPFGLRELGKTEKVGNKPVISYLDGGTKRTFETTREIANAAKSLNREQLGLLGRILSVPTRVLRLGATGINLPFMASNLVRDQATMFINSDKALKTSLANPKNFTIALFNALGHGKEYGALMRAGAGGTSFDLSRDSAKETVARVRSGRNLGSAVLYTVRHPSELLRVVEDTIGKSEELGRIQQFRGTREALLKDGKSKEDADILAAHAARNNSTNFARSGDYGRVLNASLPFFNASIQGSRTFVRNVQTRPAQTATKLAVTTFMPVAAITAWNLGDDERRKAYENISDYEKDGNIIIVPPHPVKDDKGRWNVIKIPLSQEVANLASIVRGGIEAAKGSKNIDMAKIAGELLGTATGLNTGSPREFVGQVIPQGLKPAIEGLTNTNLFTGNQIVPRSLQDYPAGMQYKPTTSGTAVKIGKTLGVSPLQVENAIATAGGGVGRQLLNASDQALAKAGKINSSQIAGQDIGDNFVSKFAKAKGISDEQLQYEQEQAAKKDKAAQSAPKKLQEAGLEKGTEVRNPTTGLVDTRATGRVKKAKEGLAPNLPKSAASVLTDYAKLDTKGKKAYTDDPANAYQLHLAQYQNNNATGKLNPVDDYKAKQSLGKEAITSKYSNEVQDFYGMNKTQQNAYFAQDRPKATQLYDQAKQLDQELAGKGFVVKPKYKYGLGSKPKKAKVAKVAGIKKSHLNYSKMVAGSGKSNFGALRKLVSSTKIKHKNIKRAA